MKRDQGTTLTNDAALPAMFLVLAEAALTSGGRNPGIPQRLHATLPFLAPVFTVENLIARKVDVCEAALQYHQQRRGVNVEDVAAISDAAEVGVVAGFLLAQMLAGKDGAQ